MSRYDEDIDKNPYLSEQHNHKKELNHKVKQG